MSSADNAAVMSPGQVDVWSTGDARLLASLPGGPFSNAAFTPDGRWLVVGTTNDIQIWDTNSWKYVRTVVTGLNREDKDDLTFSPDGRLMICQVSADRFQFRSMPGFAELFILQTSHALTRRFTGFSKDSTRFYVLDAANLLYEWNIAALRSELATRGFGEDRAE